MTAVFDKTETYALITEKNCEKLCSKEIKNRFNIATNQNKGFVDIQESYETALKIAYFSQTAKRFLLKIGNSSFADLDDLLKKISEDIKKGNWHKLLTKDFKTNCTRTGIHDFNSVIVEQEVSNLIKKELTTKNINITTDYNSKDVVFFISIEDNNYLLGIDLLGKDLSKRHYLIFNNPNAIKGTIAYNLLLFSDYNPNTNLIDPFSLAGVITIEAAIYSSNTSINFFSKEFNYPNKIKTISEELITKFDEEITKNKPVNNIFSCDQSFPNIAAQKKNSRIAGVERFISFSRTDLKNLDIKNFGKDIDMVVTRIIEPSKNVPEQKASKVYEDFFVATKEFLTKKGTINVIIRNPELFLEHATKHGYKVKEQLETAQGQQQFLYIKLIKSQEKSNKNTKN